MLSGEKEEPALFTEMKWKMIGGDKKWEVMVQDGVYIVYISSMTTLW
jgi:hypothetical protein